MLPILVFPYIDPTIVRIGGLSVRWYGLMYVLAFVLGSWLLGVLVRRYRRIALTPTLIGDLVFWVTIGVILGGRIGYVLFYNLPYYLGHPLSTLAIWEGGMSFHGGLIGVAVAGSLFSRKYRLSLLPIGDLLAVPSALGLAFGRVGNFLNAELVGRPTDLPWGMLFPGELTPRHPSQLYAVAKDLLLFVALWQVYRRSKVDGTTIFSLLLLYGCLRFLVEFTREPDVQIGYIGPFTLGQLLCIPMVLIGGGGLIWLRPKRGTRAWKKDGTT